jgi:hypothetical protein
LFLCFFTVVRRSVQVEKQRQAAVHALKWTVLYTSDTRKVFFLARHVAHFFLKTVIPAKPKKLRTYTHCKHRKLECLQQPSKTKTNIVGPAQKSSGAWGVTAATSRVTARSPRAQRQAHQRKNARGGKAEPGTRHSVFFRLIFIFFAFRFFSPSCAQT